jgi:hypothetical protein
MSSVASLRRRSPRSKNCYLPIGNLHRQTLLETPLRLLACRRSGDEENLYGQTGPVPGFHLLLQQNPPMLAVGGRAAALFSSLSAFCASDDLMILTLEARGLIKRTPGQARSIHLLIPREEIPDLA